MRVFFVPNELDVVRSKRNMWSYDRNATSIWSLLKTGTVTITEFKKKSGQIKNVLTSSVTLTTLIEVFITVTSSSNHCKHMVSLKEDVTLFDLLRTNMF